MAIGRGKLICTLKRQVSTFMGSLEFIITIASVCLKSASIISENASMISETRFVKK